MLSWVFGHYECFTPSVQGSTLDIRLLIKVGPRTEGLKYVLNHQLVFVPCYVAQGGHVLMMNDTEFRVFSNRAGD